MKVTIELTEEQLSQLAEAVSTKIAKPEREAGRPFTLSEAAKALTVSWHTVKRYELSKTNKRLIERH